MISLPDLWVPPASANPTHNFRGAGVTDWPTVTIENDTGVQLLVSNNPDSPPSTDVATAWRLVPPGANVTWPLNSPGVAYRLLGTPAAGTAVQTILSDQAAPAGGTTGTVNVTSGTLTVTGPVNVQTATGVNLSTFSGFATAATIAINAGVTTQTITILPNVQRLVLLHGTALPGGHQIIGVAVTGVTTGTNYYNGNLGDLDQLAISVAGSSTGISIDTQVTVTIFAAVTGGDLVVVQSYASPGLSANDLFPASQVAAVQNVVKNLYVVDVGGKSAVHVSVAGANQSVVLVPAPGVGQFISVQHLAYTPSLVQAGSFLQVGGGAVASTPILTSDPAVALIQYSYPLHGFTLSENTELRAITNAGATPTWSIFVVYQNVSV